MWLWQSPAGFLFTKRIFKIQGSQDADGAGLRRKYRLRLCAGDFTDVMRLIET